MSSADAATVAYVHGTEVAHSFHRSLTDMLLFDLGKHGRLMRGGFIAVRYSTGGIVKARNEAVHMFLDAKDSDWLFWVDTDMGFAPDTLDRLIAVADRKTKPVVGALCFASKELRPDGLNGYWTGLVPTVMDWRKLPTGESGFAARFDYDRNSVVRCSGTGSACIVIHRSVFERIGADWYEPLRNPDTGDLLGEDLSFCARAGALDIPIHVHTGVKTSHLKPLWVAEEQFDMWVHQ